MLQLDWIAFIVGFVGIFSYPTYNRLSKRKDNLIDMNNAFEGYFHAIARHSVYNVVRLATLSRREVNYVKKYNLEKQKYDYSIITELKKDYIKIFPPEIVKKIIQFELLARNFNSDLDKFLRDISQPEIDNEYYISSFKNIVDKNIRLFSISHNARTVFKRHRETILEPRSNGFINKISSKNKSTYIFSEKETKFLVEFTNILIFLANYIYLLSKSFINIVMAFSHEFTGNDKSFNFMQKQNSIVDEINYNNKVSITKIRGVFDTYVSHDDTRLRREFDGNFQFLMEFMSS